VLRLVHEAAPSERGPAPINPRIDMKIFRRSLVLLASGLCLGALTQSKEKTAAPAEAAQDTFTPGPQHARLQKRVGSWDAVVIMADPTGAEQRSNAKMAMTKHSDFHTIENFDGEFMGMPFKGHGINGYCPLRKQYYTLWTDSMAASPLVLYGDWDEKKGELTLTGEGLGMSGKLEKFRTVTKYPDDDHIAWALYGPGPDGNEALHLRIEYARKK